MDISLLNIWAILVATLSTFVIGWLWYGSLWESLDGYCGAF
ncbi:MAG: hypothetical protein U5J95_03295 [Balneolaceae bacterium]|nr:hypothetical protein [Balneolaceae bacterium]